MIHKALTIAGSDSGGGAGIQADLKTFAAHHVWGSSVVTAVTAQNSKEVSAVQGIEGDIISKQIDAVLSDIGADAVKIGMLANSEIISTVAEGLKRHGVKTIVLDPVMVATSGAKLLEDSAIESLKKELFPLATIVTPNLDEAEVLVGHKVTVDNLKESAEEILALGCSAVLLKGGHLEGEHVFDYFTDGEHSFQIENVKLDKEGHGSGCTLSSAIAAQLAKGEPLEHAVRISVAYVHQALVDGFQVGSENFVLKHL